MKFIYDEEDFKNDFSDYIFQRLESAEYSNEIHNISNDEDYFKKVEEIKNLVSEDHKHAIDELSILVDKYISMRIKYMYITAFIDGYNTKKELINPNNENN